MTRHVLLLLGMAISAMAAAGCVGDQPLSPQPPAAITCTPTNGANLVPNPGFNATADGWASMDPMGWASDDAASCPSSGSLTFHDAIINSECIPVSGGVVYRA